MVSRPGLPVRKQRLLRIIPEEPYIILSGSRLVNLYLINSSGKGLFHNRIEICIFKGKNNIWNVQILSVMKKNMEINNGIFKCVCILFSFICIYMNSCGSGGTDAKVFTISIRGIGFDCRLPQVAGDTLRLKPIVMYIDMDIINNTNVNQVIGSYNHRYNQEGKKYGYFTLIDKADTIRLYSNDSSLFEIGPRDSISMQLYYEGIKLLDDDPFLDRMSIAWTGKEKLSTDNVCMSDIEFMQRFINSLKIGYISFDADSFDNTDFDTRISSEMLFVDYNFSDDKAFEMRKSPSGWVLDFKNSN